MKESFIILGARGTMPVSGRQFLKYGGNTTCFCLKTAGGKIIIDAGLGITLLGEDRDDELRPATLLFTHFHLDHVIGLPFFKRLYNPGSFLCIMADPARADNWRSTLKDFVRPPYWPLKWNRLPAAIEMKDLPRRTNFMNLNGIRVSWCGVSHPQGCLAYRLDTPAGSVAIVTDHEHGDRKREQVLQKLCAGCDHLIYDAQYLPDEIKAHHGWGHGTWEEGVALARAAEAGELILTHHDYKRRDDEIDAIVKTARRRFPKTRAACENMVLF